MPSLGIVASAHYEANPIVAENQLSGYAPASWQITGIGDSGALGFATAMSVQAGSSITFKIHTGGTGYSLEVVRLGWYGGNGARLVHTASGRPGVTQSEGTLRTTGESSVGSRDCSGWTVTDTWAVPSNAVHGVYLGIIKRTGQASFGHIGPFVVHSTYAATAAIVCKLSDMTWRAYNTMGTLAAPTGGKSLYGIGSGSFTPGSTSRAWDVSYDAPLVTASGVPQTSYWNGEQPVHTWLERNGYDVAYASCLDIEATPSILSGRQVIMSCGHDEYWSQTIRDAWDAAIDSGVNAIVASGNTMFWRVRMSSRLMICYKNSHSQDGGGTGIDPVTWTGTWRDTRWPDRRPECESIGTVFIANAFRDDEIVVRAAHASMELWRNTTAAALTGGTTETLKTDGLGFEWDTFESSYANTLTYPPGLKLLSLTTVDLTNNTANENGSIYTEDLNPATHYIVAFQRGTALVVNFGTNQWGWGLSNLHVRGAAGENTTMKQATVNLLADMGCQPATLQSGLTPATSTTWTFPTPSSLTLPTTASVDAEETTQLAATTVWSNGITTNTAPYATWGTSNAAVATVVAGLVTGVAEGIATITATQGSATDTCAVTVNPAGVETDTWLALDYTYPGATNSDGAITIGTKFAKRSTHTAPIYVNGVRWWRTSISQSAAPVAYLAASGGANLASKTSTLGSGVHPGWEEFMFTTPVEITTTSEYIVWVWVPSGGYAALSGYFASANTVSRLGWFDSGPDSGAGKFRQPPAASPDATAPTAAFGNAFYLVEPLIAETVEEVDPGDPTGVTVTPATAGIAPAATQALTAMVSWENISPTDETLATAWTTSASGVATVGASTGIVTGVTDGTATITGTYAGFTDTCVVTVTTPAVTYDTLTAAGSSYAGATNEGGTSINVGLGPWQRNNPAQTLTVHGVRFWRTTQNQTIAPTVGLAIVGAAALRTQVSAAGTGSKPAGWEQVIFTTPYTLNTNDNFVVWVNLRSGGYPATGAAFTAGQDSQAGLYTISEVGSGKFIYTTTATTQPTGGSTASFWVEPLVTLA